MGLAPSIVEGPAGSLFSVHFTPDDAAWRPGGAVLYLPPFAEEMNRARRMAALMARTLNRDGLGVLVLDPYGTGDSAGEFKDATWSIWCDDARAACRWLAEWGYQKISLVGLRLGGCLALETARLPEFQDILENVVLWQPVTTGETFLNQFLRIRVAAGLSDGAGGTKETVKELRAKLADSAMLEVAGYEVSVDLTTSIAALNLAELARSCSRPISWLELGSGDDVSPAVTKIGETLAADGIDVMVRALPGEPFWSIEEPALVPALWQATAEIVVGGER